ncbi:Hypothetical predicted protein [Mytilus galloprovincialis]|uniref:CCHC-type domain-containing protein n=1 Tax=Mytilus galloprovincialis TaxID=29158 RepID=A0A8B6F7V0_MYTGA|nr:Hypothetical predicted protein [Mytilus galloprovincialis]
MYGNEKSRQKLIKLANSSDAGWRVVDEYTTNLLAEDSEDEKRIYKAQSRADSKIKKEKAKRKTDTRPAPYKTKSLAPENPIPVNTNKMFRPGRCFNCSETGHWRRECPHATVQHTNKIKGGKNSLHRHGQDALPAQPVHVALYLTNLLNNGSTSHPVSNALYGIKWAHEVSGLLDPTTKSSVTSIVEASKRTTTKSVNKEDPEQRY